MNLVAIDPGIDQGWATYVTNTLESCGLGEPPLRQYRHELIIECPQIYPASKADPNDLIKLAIRVGRQLEKHERQPAWLLTTMVLPREWKGQVPKPVHHRRIRATLTSPELATLDRCLSIVATGLQHNVMDAVGLGLYGVGRLRP